MPGNPAFYRDAGGRPVVETRFRVRFHETDAMGIVHHAAYLTWFEEGRSAYSRAMGYPYAQLAGEGIDWAVIEVSARYAQPARYDEEVVVATCLEELRSRMVSFSYQVRQAASGTVLATGTTRHIAVDRKGRPVRIPNAVREIMEGSRAWLGRGDQPSEG